MKIAVWGLGSHALKNTLPALAKTPTVDVIGVFSRNTEVVQANALKYGCKSYASSELLLADSDIEGVYLATPIALHYTEGKRILEAGKHLFVEKSSVTCLKDAETLVGLAKSKGLVIAECFMYKYHNQCKKLLDIIESGELGAVRQIHARFGFPHLSANDIRYKKELGGGALLDAGTYTISFATLFAKSNIKLRASTLVSQVNYEVDTDGIALFTLNGNISFVASWGFGRSYKNEIEVWGEEGTLYANRFFSKPEGLGTEIMISKQVGDYVVNCPPENHFVSMFRDFSEAVYDAGIRGALRKNLIAQALIVENVLKNSMALGDSQ
ncbi:MAG: Gfo/Idh/MocA family oxidoreductase [Gammaproteobacteria bacterium]|nr:Gfo/Idh/MocA family oxidoreductase [Gammaproteobacteria bacterium]